ncbi:glycosyltransferase [Vagococcus carniphilus]|uniref:glycosyltransferase n=1 Tax=Vagococcus carniphilus TaxID=218144 RepID=UPI002891C455|nr:glycosyltransferase [Vagococcus carniphilus]MDT2830949.1 glycosyltransferase [Vagococcus carniphilus]MDT2838154.1 glycosyltransferase [Vagococcus carniphilus]MDT2853685.1 glycosyltransferase [Vagococcus carniphilus]
MKKVLIVNYYFKFGGISSSLSNMLEKLSEESQYSVDLLLLNDEVDPKYQIPDNIKLLKVNFITRIFFKSFKENYTDGLLYEKLISGLLFFLCKIFGFQRITEFVIDLEKKHGDYDIVISFSNDIYRKNSSFFERSYSGGCNYFAEKKVNAKYKIAWIHNDPEKLGFNYDICFSSYKNFDKIVNVSTACKKKFDAIIPEFQEKSIVIGNSMDIKGIREKALENNPYCESTFNIITVARIDNQQKRIDKILFIAEKLRKENLNFIWTIVGDGPDLEKLQNLRDDMNLEANVQFVGKKNNPYPYMKNANCLVVTSDYEAQGMVITEAILNRTPVISTNFDASFEFIDDGINGFIVDKEVNSIFLKIEQLIKEPYILENMKKNMKENIKDDNFEKIKVMLEGY